MLKFTYRSVAACALMSAAAAFAQTKDDGAPLKPADETVQPAPGPNAIAPPPPDAALESDNPRLIPGDNAVPPDPHTPAADAERAGELDGARDLRNGTRPARPATPADVTPRAADESHAHQTIPDAADSTPGTANSRDAQSPAALGVSFGEQLTIDEVVPGSPAARAGLQAGDQLVSVDGRTFTSPDAMIDAIRQSPQSQDVAIEFTRNGERHRANVRLGGWNAVYPGQTTFSQYPPSGSTFAPEDGNGPIPHTAMRFPADVDAAQPAWSSTGPQSACCGSAAPVSFDSGWGCGRHHHRHARRACCW